MAGFYKRYTDGEMISSDSIHFPDSLSYKTLINKRTVYGGGGIMPDLFVAADTSGYSVYYRNLVRRGIINSFALEYFDKNRNRLKTEYKDFEYFDKVFGFRLTRLRRSLKRRKRRGEIQ